MGRRLTLRGQMFNVGELKLLFEYEGTDLSRGWKIISGQAWDIDDVTKSHKGIMLHTDDQQHVRFMLGDSQIVGWLGFADNYKAMTPDHVIVSRLYGTGLAANLTYLIELEEVKITDIENVIYQIKERAQSALE